MIDRWKVLFFRITGESVPSSNYQTFMIVWISLDRTYIPDTLLCVLSSLKPLWTRLTLNLITLNQCQMPCMVVIGNWYQLT